MIDRSFLFYVLISLYLCFFVDDAPSSMSPVYWPLSVVLCLFFVLILALVRFRTFHCTPSLLSYFLYILRQLIRLSLFWP